MDSHHTLRSVGVAALAAAAVVALSAPSSADPGGNGGQLDVFEEIVEVGFYYDTHITGDGNAGDLLLFAGGEITGPEGACADTGVETPLRIAMRGTPPDQGAHIHESLATTLDLALYDGEGMNAEEFLGTYCPVYLAGGTVPEPMATGSGTVRADVSVQFFGPDQIEHATMKNSVKGWVETPEGEAWRVSAFAHLTLAPEFSVDKVLLNVNG